MVQHTLIHPCSLTSRNKTQNNKNGGEQDCVSENDIAIHVDSAILLCETTNHNRNEEPEKRGDDKEHRDKEEEKRRKKEGEFVHKWMKIAGFCTELNCE